MNNEKTKKTPPILSLDDEMKMRDELASRCMQSLMVNVGRNGYDDRHLDKIASRSYEMADAMLEARGSLSN